MAEPPLNILMVSPEAVPYAKTGGLADVVGALPRELAARGHRVGLVVPRYGGPAVKGHGFDGFREWGRVAVPTATGLRETVIEEGPSGSGGLDGNLPVYAVRHDPFFDRKGLYQESGLDYPDNLERFAFFCQAVMALVPALSRRGWSPELLHLHDWQTALCPAYLRLRAPGARELRTLLTVHNLGYQGLFPGPEYAKTGLPPEFFTPQGLEFYGSVNVLKGGLLYSDFLTTVSPTYSREIQTPEQGFGLEGVIAERRDRLVGVVNGIDVNVWNPATDPHLPARYSLSDLAGKRACKMELQREMNLPVREVPVIGLVSRLTVQKGLDLVAAAVPQLMALDLQMVLLGTGDPAAESQFKVLQVHYPGKFGVRIGFDEGLAHRIEGGADLFLMPSRYEPCGLSQLYSLRYGTVPVVRRTGGLADTVAPYGRTASDGEPATGFAFDAPTSAALLEAVGLALEVYRDREEWLALMEAGMRTDVSWARSALTYEDVYRRMLSPPD